MQKWAKCPRSFICNRQINFHSDHSDFSVCDREKCDPPEVPRCEDGQTVVLMNPGECQPMHQCGMFTHPPLYRLCKREDSSMLTLLVTMLQNSFLSQSAKRKSALSEPPRLVPHIASSQWKRQRAVMCLNVRAAARTPHTPAAPGSSHPPQPTTVAAQRPAACPTRWVHVCVCLCVCVFVCLGLTHTNAFLCCYCLTLSCFLVVCLCRCVWSVGWFTQWAVDGRRDVRSAVAPSCRTKRHLCTSLSVLRLSAIGHALG